MRFNWIALEMILIPLAILLMPEYLVVAKCVAVFAFMVFVAKIAYTTYKEMENERL